MFDPIKVTKVPPQSEHYYWADFVEILCLTDVDGQFSAAQLAELANFADDFMATSPDAQDGDAADIIEISLGDTSGEFEEWLAEVDSDSQTEDDAVGEIPYASYGRETEQTDDRYRWCEDLFRLLAERQRALGRDYPFLVDAAAMRIELADGETAHRRYIFYLSCSLLGSVSSSVMHRLTAWFEVVSGDVLRELLPGRTEVDHYGTARGFAPSRFVGTQYERLVALARELRGIPIADATDFHPRDSGDNGLDLVAWLPMLDDSKGMPSFFVQCACGKRWDGKQYEAAYERWKEFVVLTSPPAKITFIPHFFRRAGGDWYAASDVSGVLVDRLRALRLPPSTVTHAEVEALIDDALNFKREVV